MSILGGGALGEFEAQRRMEEREQKVVSGDWGFRHDNRIIRAIWAPATVIVVLLGVATGEIIISLVAATVLVAGWAAWSWTRYALNRLESRIEVSQSHAFVGETLGLTLRLENRKILPLTALQVRINLPEILEPSNEPFSRLHESAPQEGVVVRSTSMRWYERLILGFPDSADHPRSLPARPRRSQVGRPVWGLSQGADRRRGAHALGLPGGDCAGTARLAATAAAG